MSVAPGSSVPERSSLDDAHPSPTSPSSSRPRVVVMGVSGCGKSTVGESLARELDVPFMDGDDLHPRGNIEKMASGTPLTDDDRWPWLTMVGEWLAGQSDGGVIACSALKRAYRDRIRAAAPDTVFVHLHGSRELMGARVKARSVSQPEHFMPESLLDSQFATLEPLGGDEAGRVFDVAASSPAITADAAAWLRA